MRNSKKQALARGDIGVKLIITIGLFLSFSFIPEQQKKSSTKTGKELFESKCANCHGNDGTGGKWGAKNLQLSTMKDEELVQTISNGKRVMPAWKYSLTQEDIGLIKNYIKTLRK